MTTSNSRNQSNIDPSEQLKLLTVKCQRIIPDLYRDYALYLQVLRSILLSNIRNSIITLITSQPGHNINISSDRSQSFQRVVDEIVAKCSSLITIEYIIDLANEIDKENQHKIENTRMKLFQGQVKESSSFGHKAESSIPSDDIYLSSYPPIENPSQIDNWFSADQFGAIREAPKTDLLDDIPENLTDFQHYEDDKNQPEKETFKPKVSSENPIDLLKSLFSLAGTNSNSANIVDDKEELRSDSQENNIDPSQPSLFASLMPEQPQELMIWINAFEYALSRRLRNLSHALNLELLKSGLVNSIVPLTLLDAAISGHLSSEYTDSNLLRLNIPINPSMTGDEIEICCLLIRLSDLEFDNPKLRKCRSRIRKYHKEIIVMVRQQRYWQARSVANELHQKWWQNPPEKSVKNLQTS